MADQLLPQRIVLRDNDATRSPLPGGTALFVQTGTGTPVSITDADGVALANPLTADSTGALPPVYYGGGSVIDCLIRRADGSLVETVARVPRFGEATTAAAGISFLPSAGIAATDVQGALEELADGIAAQSLTTAQRYATYGGTANAITLDSGADLAARVVGMAFRFLATAANTGATTINLDGLGAQSCVTVTGAALPSGYVRTDVETVAWWTGTNWRVGRLPENGGTTNSGNGSWNRLADGTQECEVIIDDTAGGWTAASGALFMRTTGLTWTYAKAFAAVPAVGAPMAERGADIAMGCAGRNPTTTSVTLNPWSAVSLGAGSTTKTVHVTAKGRWYV